MPVNQDPLLLIQGCVSGEGEGGKGGVWVVVVKFPCWEVELHGERETEARREDVAHRWGVSELGFPPIKI